MLHDLSENNLASNSVTFPIMSLNTGSKTRTQLPVMKKRSYSIGLLFRGSKA
jgi:hypothetical protein